VRVTSHAIAFGLALALALGLTPLMGVLAVRLGAVSEVGGRNVNTREIPRLGGVAVAVATLAPLVLLFILRKGVARLPTSELNMVLGLGTGAALSCVLGAIDDVRRLSAPVKLIGQLLFALLAYAAGCRIGLVELPFLGRIDATVLSVPLTVIWIVGITNAINLIDGLDGLAAGVVFCAAATNLVVAGIGGHTMVALVMSALMGALLGFLFFNFNPATIFMGDSGSYFAGFLLAASSLVGNQKASTAVSLIVPILALGVPIFDTIFSIIRRAVLKRPVFSPDRGHIHHKLLDLGLTHRRAVLILYLFSALLALSALLMSIDRNWTTGFAMLLASGLIFGLFRLAGSMARRHSLRPPGDRK
jgi:UDP-GlcNAc:undecaprenyl-phosphate/decaprenyl-phosphate GlcNAc-1-phosphate transferase